MNKQVMLHWAEAIDSYRIIPRLFLAACLFWTMQISHILLQWYTHLGKDERGLEASGFASIVFLAVFGFLKLVFETYSKNGRDWNQQPSTTTVERASVTTTTPATP